MSAFDSSFAAVAAGRLASHFGETLVYKPHGRPARIIKARVDRDPPRAIDETGRSLGASIVIVVRNVQTSTADDGMGGILASELNTSYDRISIATRIGEMATDRQIKTVLSQSGANLVLGVQ